MVTGETQFFDPAYASPEDETAYAQMWIEAYALFSDEGEALAEALGWRGMVGENYFDSPYRYLQATHREWKVVKGEEQPWRLSETEGARLVREGFPGRGSYQGDFHAFYGVGSERGCLGDAPQAAK